MTAAAARTSPSSVAPPSEINLPDLVRRAKELLQNNRRGDHTIPAAGLYPHQWSWDSAFVAIGLSHYDPAAAKQELRTLFRGQWANGLLPHIVFSEGDDGYVPGPDWWDSARSPHAPRRADGTPIKTSGLVQPPVHATAVLQVADRDPDPAAAAVWLREMHPKLVAWHDYLYRERDVDGNGLVYIRHPWESGMDNSPLWDEPLSRLEVPAGSIPDYKRSDREHADPDSRPDDATYDRYVLLVELAKACDYDEDRLRRRGGPDGGEFPFRVEDVLFNSLLARSEQDLAEIARRVGADDAPHRRRADATAAYLNANLWCPDTHMYRNYDLAADKPFLRRVAGGFAPLFAGVPGRDQAERMRQALRSTSFNACADGCDDGVGFAVASFDRDHPEYNSDGYWRGPIWMNVDWLLLAGLRGYRMAGEESVVRDSMLKLPAQSGFREHYDAETGAGGGAEDFSWSAALLIDLAATEFGLDVRAV